jgi:hypothetical protein
MLKRRDKDRSKRGRLVHPQHEIHGLIIGAKMPFLTTRPSQSGPIRLATPQRPFCEVCRSDEFLVYEEFVPARVLTAGTGKPAEASYTCIECGQFSAHAVPDGWEPPGWFWYA